MNKKAKSPTTGQIRIIGGQWRSRKLPVPVSPGLRPTTDRIRETLFNWLAPYVAGSHCLDCFAGSGALTLEALSRYATKAIMLEKQRAIAVQLQQNLQRIEAKQATVVQTDTLCWLEQSGQPFDIVFIDPPFRQGLIEPVVLLLENNHWLSNDAWIYIECEVELKQLDVPTHWRLHREKQAGQVIYRLYHRQIEQNQNNVQDKKKEETYVY